MNLIRAVDQGASIDLAVWAVDVDDARFAVFGFFVGDDSVHPAIVYGACRIRTFQSRIPVAPVAPMTSSFRLGIGSCGNVYEL
jgi:hypothetical protein